METAYCSAYYTMTIINWKLLSGSMKIEPVGYQLHRRSSFDLVYFDFNKI